MSQGRIPIVMVTGFLGSGKTTFLNELVPRLRSQGRRVAVIVNEVGQQGFDSRLVKETDHLAEVLRGSVFCACVRADVVRVLRFLATTVRPDVVVIEATGVADPGEQGGFSEDELVAEHYRLACVVCLAAADRLFKLVQTMAAARRQVTVAGLVVLTGTDRAKAEDVAQSRSALARHNPNAAVVEAPYARLPEAVWRRLLGVVGGELTDADMAGNSIDAFDSDPVVQVRDIYKTRVLSVPPLAADVDPLRTLQGMLPAGTERAKGVVQIGAQLKLFQFANGVAQLAEAPAEAESGRLYLVGRF